MTFRVLITESIADEGVDYLRESGECEVELSYGLTRDELLATIGSFDALIVRSGTQVDAETIAAGTRLRVVARAGSGFDNIDVVEATNRQIAVTTAPDANTNAAAEMTLSLMMALARNVGPAHRSLAEGKWDRSGFIGSELAGKTVGVIGYGRVGERVATLCAALGMSVIAQDFITDLPPADIRASAVEEVLAVADVVTLHAFAGDEPPLIGEAAIALMKPGAMLINVARGSLVDAEALAAALDRGHLSGAAIDVFDPEPPGLDHPLVGHPRVLHTPHLGASTVEARVRVAHTIASQTLTILRGDGYPNCVNKVSSQRA